MKLGGFTNVRAASLLLLAMPAALLIWKGLSLPGGQTRRLAISASHVQGPSSQTTIGEQEPNYDDTLRAYTELRAYPEKVVNWQQFMNAAQYRDTYPYPLIPPALHGGVGGPPVAGWAYIGPKNMPGPGGFYGGAPAINAIYNGYGPLAGRVNAAVIVNGTANSPIFVGSSNGGVWQGALNSPDWTWLSADWDWLSVSCIAMKPQNANEMLVGTGDYHGSKPLGGVGIRKGVFNSGTNSWGFNNVGRAAFHGKAVSKIVYDPENPNIVIATTGRGGTAGSRGDVWRSTDAGDTWALANNINRATTLNWSDVVCGALSPTTGRRFYYAIGYTPTTVEIWRSADKGASWALLTNPGTMPTGASLGLSLATSPSQWNTVYVLAGMQSAGGATTSQIYRSINAGKTWTTLVTQAAHGNFPWDTSAATVDAYNWSQSDYDYFLSCGEQPAAGGTKVDVVYAGLITLAQSSDAGATWRDIGYAYAANPNVTNADPDFRIHNDHQCMGFQPGNYNRALVGCDGGVYVMNYDPAGAAAHNVSLDPSLNQKLAIGEFYKGAWGVDDNNPDMILGGTQDNGSPLSDGAHPPAWRKNLAFGDGSGSAIAGRGSFYIYGSGYTGGRYMNFKRTYDGLFWNSPFRPIPPGDPQPNFDDDRTLFAAGDTAATFPPLASDRNNADFCYTASDRLYKFVYGQGLGWGTSDWTRVSTQVLSATQYVTAITVDPINDVRLYTGSLDGELWRSTYYGLNTFWTQVNAGAHGNLPGTRPISDIAVNPNDPNQIFVVLNGAAGVNDRVWVCDDVSLDQPDRGWRSIRGPGLPPDLPINCIALDPSDPSNVIYVGTDIGVFYTNNGGVAWSNGTAPLGLPNVAVTSLSVVGAGAGRTLSASTYGRGTWRTSLPLP